MAQPRILHPVKLFFTKKDEIKIVSDNKGWGTCLARNSKESPLGYKEIIPDDNLNLHEVINSTCN